MSIHKWKIQYTAEVEGIYFEESIIFNLDDLKVKVQIDFSNSKDFIKDKINFIFLDFESITEEDVKQKTKIIVDNLINIMADKFLAAFTNLHILYIEKTGEKRTLFSGTTLKKINNIELNENSKEDIINSLNDQSYLDFLKNNGQHILFKTIMFSENNVGSFVAMYSLLFEITNNYGTKEGRRGQKLVDDFIRSQSTYWSGNDDRDSQIRKDSQGIPVKETKYTWLRNQIGHTNLNTNYIEVEKEIEQSYLDLMNLVKNAIHMYLK